MTNEQINKTIATHIFGFEDYDMLLSFSGAPERKLYGATKFANNWTPVPDYCNDLNAMHDAEKMLTNDQADDYVTTLCLQVQPEPKLFHATASQRAKAFLKTIGKWEQ